MWPIWHTISLSLFQVMAKGVMKAPVEWLFDANISLCKLLGKLCAVTLDNKAAGMSHCFSMFALLPFVFSVSRVTTDR